MTFRPRHAEQRIPNVTLNGEATYAGGVTPAGWNRPLLLCAVAMVPFLSASLIGLAVDDRHLVGAPIWLKPFKFSVSILAFAGTWAWLVSYLSNRRLIRGASAVIAFVLLLEMVLITVQTVRGHQSHFNNATPLDAAIFSTMGTAIAVLTIMTIILTIALLRRDIGDRSVTWAVRLGAGIALAGALVGPVMTSPRPDQVRAMQRPDFDGILGAHSIGGQDGGAIIPVTGWSAELGDLRVAHFVGLHALQVLPLLALALLLLARVVGRLESERRRTRLVLVSGAGYAGLFALTLWQALRAQSVIDPDRLTLTALTAGLAVVLAGCAVVALLPERPRERT